MAIYIVLMLIALSGYFLGANRTETSRKYYVAAVFTAILLAAMLRSSQVGTDLRVYYGKYFPMFQTAAWSRLQAVTVSGNWEWGFCAFCKLIGYISTDVQCFIVCSSVVCIVPYALFIYRNSDDVVFSTVFYLGYHIYMMSLNVVRQAMAVGIVLLGLEALKRKRYYKYIMFVGIAMLFHTSAVIALLLVVCDGLKFNKNTFYALAFAAVVFSAGFRFVLEQLLLNFAPLSFLYGIYSASGVGDSGGYITFHTLGMFLIACAVFLLAYLYYYSPWERKRPYKYGTRWNRRYYIKGTILYRRYENPNAAVYWSESMLMYAVYFAVLFRLSAFIMNVAARFALYFIPFLLIAFPHTCSKIQDSKSRRTLQAGMLAIVLVFFFFIGFTRAGGLWGTVPYQFFW